MYFIFFAKYYIASKCISVSPFFFISPEVLQLPPTAELQVGADIIKRALSYPLRLVAHNAGENGYVVLEKVRSLGVPACRPH